MNKDHRYTIRLPETDSLKIEQLSSRLDVDKSMIIRFCISSTLKMASITDVPKSIISPELAFLREAMCLK